MGPDTWKPHGASSGLHGVRTVERFPVHEVLGVADCVDHIWAGTIQHCDTPHEYISMHSLDVSVKVLEGSTVPLCMDVDIRILQCKVLQGRL